jgi:hypothetical protein
VKKIKSRPRSEIKKFDISRIKFYQIDMAPFKQNTRRNLALKRRDVYGICSVDMVVVKSLSECLMNITKLKKHLKKVVNLTDETLMRIKKLQLTTVQRIHLQLQVERAIPLLGIRM